MLQAEGTAHANVLSMQRRQKVVSGMSRVGNAWGGSAES